MKSERVYPRFPLIRRIEHWVMVLSFITLALTGLPQKYPEAEVSLALFRWIGGIEVARQIHHVAAVMLILITMVHLGSLGYDVFVVGKRPSIWFSKADVLNAWRTLMYNLGLSKARPKQGWYTFEEKLEYWALIWGTLVMIITGFFLWNPILASQVFPGDWIPAAKIAHGSEAVLAVLAVLIWHTYHVHLRHFNKSMFTGVLTEEEMQEEHPLYLETGPEPPKVPPEERPRRQRWYWPAFGVLALLWLMGTYWFVTAEVTAVSEPLPLPERQRLPVYQAPQPTPLPPLPWEAATGEGQVTWAQMEPLLEEQCGYCHGGRHGFGRLDVTSYESVLQGGVHGPAVLPGQPGASPLWFWPQRADHPLHLDEDALRLVWQWIAQGAP